MKKASLKTLRLKANKLWADLIKREGKCIFVGQVLSDGCQGFEQESLTEFEAEESAWAAEPHVCKGFLQAMHAFGKKAHPSVRYELWNGFPGCSAAHAYFTWQPHRWENWLRGTWGARQHEKYFRQACQTAKLDMEAVVESLK